MGYTHYFKAKEDLDKDLFSLWADQVQLIISEARNKGIEISGWDGTGSPEITDELVSFNGSGDESFETFRLTRQKDPKAWTFCKTGRSPYDPVVCASLISLNMIFGDKVEVSSDGCWDDESEWVQGANLFEATLSAKARRPFHVRKVS